MILKMILNRKEGRQMFSQDQEISNECWKILSEWEGRKDMAADKAMKLSKELKWLQPIEQSMLIVHSAGSFQISCEEVGPSLLLPYSIKRGK